MPPSPHMSQGTVPMKDNSEHKVNQLKGEDLHCKCCCDLGLEETMTRVSGERAPAFTSEELEKLVDGVLPQYTLLYGTPDKQVQYSLLSSLPAFVLMVEEQEDKGWQDLQLWFHGVRVPRGVCRGEHFPSKSCFCRVFVRGESAPEKVADW
ncbi:hypothetical protein NDU88_003782 [Pleurodeles waltl]|uniref:Uncharacterized protein n=1 Tax=Pleurodeles waltl TaxID=8319 RepID=A0AAV7UDT9_PLEWA|nr:hypothetical protein NDU88_003782 [Pleurodeles waltl]